MKKALKILVLVFVISVLAMTVVACDVDCPNGHTWDGGTVTKQPTCTEAGERTYTCAVCGTTRTAAVEALGHSYNYVPEVPADCKTAGTAAHYTCSRCDKLFVSQNGEMKEVTASELVVTANHSYNSGIVTKYPTCTEAGEKTYTCLSCGETKTEVIASTGHDYGEEIAEVPATCTTSGTKAHYECANCHKLFVDAEGEKTQVTVAEITLAPAHSFDDGVVTTQPTCQATGIKTYTCSACHATHTELVPATGHDYGDGIAEVPATCTTQGTAAHYQCASCGKLFVDDNGVKKEVAANELVIALVAHSYDEGTVTTQPTCEKDGVKTFACTACGHTYTEKVAATGHNYGEEIAEAAATCTATGTKAHYECANCHKLFVDVNGRKIQVTENYLTIALVPHTVVVDEAVEPTCTATGLTQGSHCSVCDAVIVAQTEIPANGHSYGELIAEVAATCEAAGTKAHYECANCHQLFVDTEGEKTEVTAEELAIEKLAHTVVIDEAVEPTCTATGLTQGSHCSVCGEVIVAQEVLDANGHTEEVIAGAPATCTETGLTDGKRCSVCGEILTEQQVVPVAEHKSVVVYDNGGHWTECETCRQVLSEKVLHEWKVSEEVPATCTQKGSVTETCACGATRSTVVSATGHTVTKVEATPATCEHEGNVEYYKCVNDNCGALFLKVGDDYVPTTIEDVTLPKAHTYGDLIAEVEATCTEAGTAAHYKCSTCGTLFVDVDGVKTEVTAEELVIAAKGHSYGEWTLTDEPTQTETGSAKRTCTVCGNEETTVVAVLTDTTVWTVETQPSTCTQAGTNTYTSQYGTVVVTLALAAHTEVVVPAVEPTCTETGLTEGAKCSVCGETLKAQEEIPAKGHDYGDLIAEVDATCTTAGTKAHYECSVCNALFVDENGEKTQVTAEDLAIPATGHTYNAAETHSNKCVNCDNEISFEEIVEIIKGLANKEETTDTYLLKGEVTGFDSFHNPYITVEGTSDTVLCYYLHEGIHDGVTYYPDDLDIGYTITVVGPLKKFNSDLEIDNGNLIGAISPQRTVTLEAVTNGTVDVVGEGSFPSTAHDGDKISFTVTADEGYKVASVTVNGEAITADADGTYTATVNGNTTIKVEIVEDSVVVPVEEVLAELTFPDDNNEYNHVGSYTDTWTAIKDGHEWTISNFNNNNWNSWTYIKAGRKSDPSVATISTHFAEQITKVVVTVDKVTASKINSLKLIVATDEKFENIVETVVAQEIATGDIEFVVTAPTANLYYKIEIDCPVAGSNGIIQISKVVYSSVICEHEWLAWTHKSDATCTESATESRICDLCGAEEIRTVGEPLGHTWGDWTSNGNGTHTGTCSLCGEKVTENCTFENGVCSVCGAQEVVTHSVTVGYTVNGNSATTLPEGVTVEILGEDGQPVTDLANVVEGTITIKVTAEGFDIVVTCNDTPVTMDGGAGTFDLTADATLSVTLTTQTEHKGTAEDPYSVADVLAISKTVSKGGYYEVNGEPVKIFVAGVISEVEEFSTSYGNCTFYIKDAEGTETLYIFRCSINDLNDIYVGDTVLLSGFLQNYNGTFELTSSGNTKPQFESIQRGERDITVTMENATTTLPTSAPIESTVTFTVTANEGYEVVSVKVNDNILTAVDGTYSFVVGETNAVVVTTQVITPKQQVSVSSDVEGYTVTTDNGITLPGEVSEGTLKFTVTAPEGYEVATVSVGETVLTLGDDGYYTTEVAGEITINVTFKIITKVSLELTSANLGLGSYNTSIKTVTVDGVDFEYLQLMKSTQYSNSIQMKSGDGYVNNVTPFGLSISQITLQAAKDLASAKVQVEMKKAEGDWVTIGTYVASDFANNQLIISVDLAKNYLYVKVSSASGALYFTSITIECEKLCEHVVETWTPNNGTHTGTCSLCGQEITEDCTYNEEHKCSVCGYAEPTRTVTVNFDETNESSTFGNYQWVNENGDVVEAPGDVYAGTVLYLKVSVNDYATHTISEVKATDTTLTVVSEDDGSKTYKFVVGTGDITITIAFEEVGVATKTWKLVTVNEQLYDGMQFVMVYKEIVAGSVVSNKYYSADESSVFGTDEITTLADTVTTFTLKASGTNWQIFDNVQQKYIVNGSTSNATLSWNAYATTKHTIFSIDIVDGEAEIKCTTQTNQYLQYNASSPRFGNYKGTMQNVCIYAYM